MKARLDYLFKNSRALSKIIADIDRGVDGLPYAVIECAGYNVTPKHPTWDVDYEHQRSGWATEERKHVR